MKQSVQCPATKALVQIHRIKTRRKIFCASRQPLDFTQHTQLTQHTQPTQLAQLAQAQTRVQNVSVTVAVELPRPLT